MSEPPPEPGLTVAVTTKNNIRTIERTLRSVRDVASRVVVVDSGSTDGTVELCRNLGAEVIEQPWQGHVKQKQFAIDQCRDTKWILLLDSDESLEPDLRESLRRAVTADDAGYDGWMLNRKVWFLGGWLHHVYQPEWRLRLFRAAKGRVSGAEDFHDRIDVQGRVGRLDGVCRHDSWRDVQDVAERQVLYARKAADVSRRGGTLLHLLFSPPLAMMKQLVLKGGFLDGYRGLIIAGLTFNYTMLKHAYLAAQRYTKR